MKINTEKYILTCNLFLDVFCSKFSFIENRSFTILCYLHPDLLPSAFISFLSLVRKRRKIKCLKIAKRKKDKKTAIRP